MNDRERRIHAIRCVLLALEELGETSDRDQVIEAALQYGKKAGLSQDEISRAIRLSVSTLFDLVSF